MSVAPKFREFLYSSLTLAVLLPLALGVAGLASGSAKLKLVLGLTGILLAFFGAIISRNPRLFCLWGLGLSIPFMFARTFGQVINKGGGEVAFNIDLSDVFLVLLCGFLARDYFKQRRRYLRVPKVSYLWMAIMLFGVYAIVAGPYRTTAGHEVFRMVKMLILFLVLVQELETPRRILHWCGALTLGLIINSIAGLIQYFYHTTLGLSDLGEPSADVTKTLAVNSLNDGVEAWRVGAFMVHPNVFGIFLAAVLPLTIACFLLRTGKLSKLYFSTAFILGTMALIATESRSGWVSFAAATACLLTAMVCHSGLRQRSTLVSAMILVVLAGIFVVEQGPILRRIFDSRESALRFRGVFNDDAKHMIAEKPLWGYGLNSYVLNLPLFATYDMGSWPPPVHQIYYLWAAETGLIGLAIHLAMWGCVIWRGIRNLRVRNQVMFAVNAACLASFLAFTMDGFVSFSPRITPTLKTMWAAAAVIMAVHYWRLRWEVYRPAYVRGALPDSTPANRIESLAPAVSQSHT